MSSRSVSVKLSNMIAAMTMTLLTGVSWILNAVQTEATPGAEIESVNPVEDDILTRLSEVVVKQLGNWTCKENEQQGSCRRSVLRLE